MRRVKAAKGFRRPEAHEPGKGIKEQNSTFPREGTDSKDPPNGASRFTVGFVVASDGLVYVEQPRLGGIMQWTRGKCQRALRFKESCYLPA